MASRYNSCGPCAVDDTRGHVVVIFPSARL